MESHLLLLPELTMLNFCLQQSPALHWRNRKEWQMILVHVRMKPSQGVELICGDGHVVFQGRGEVKMWRTWQSICFREEDTHALSCRGQATKSFLEAEHFDIPIWNMKAACLHLHLKVHLVKKHVVTWNLWLGHWPQKTLQHVRAVVNASLPACLGIICIHSRKSTEDLGNGCSSRGLECTVFQGFSYSRKNRRELSTM